MRDVLSLDSTAMHALKDVVHRSRKDGTTVLLSDVHMQPLVALTGSPVLDEIGKENLFGNLYNALNRARSLLGLPEMARPEGTGPTVYREKRQRIGDDERT
jgi:SulP family sulfate permease